MHISEIQKRLDALPAAMSTKGKIRPEAQVSIRANAAPTVYLKWATKASDPYGNNVYEWLKGDTLTDQLDAADQFIAALPTREEEGTRQFLQGLSDLIEIGKANGIDVAHVNPLIEQMKAISKNAIGFTPKPFNHDDDIPF